MKHSINSLVPSQRWFARLGNRTILGFILFAGIILCGLPVIACEACKQQQPKLLQGITHGSGPDSNWDYLIVTIMTIITLYSLYATIKCMIRPAEKENQHIKRMILNQ